MDAYKTTLDLLHGRANDDTARAILAPAGFTDWQAARHRLQTIATHPQMKEAFAACVPALLTALGSAADPDRALVDFERLTQRVRNPFALFDYLAGNPRAVEMLVTLSQGSQFLTEVVLRNPEYFDRLTDRSRLTQVKTLEQLYAETQIAVRPYAEPAHQHSALRRFQRWELLRIGACDFFGLLDLPTVTTQLSHLAESIIRVCLTITTEALETSADGFVVLAMGKLGGEELNYSSDVDLLFLADSDASTYQRLGQKLIEALAAITGDGFLYRVDVRLRPWGRAGPLVSTVETHMQYLREHARLWERQALLKARPIAGDLAVGHRFLRAAQPLVFEGNGDAETVRADVRTMKERIEAGLRRQGRDWGDVKLGEGSIRDIEFVTQYLQLVHGRDHPEVRSPTTLDALSRLSDAGLLSAGDERVLADGYVFLRTVEHYLQLMNYRQTHTLPDDETALTHLAKRLGFDGDDAGDQFHARYEQHTAAIRAVYRRYLDPESTEVDGPTEPANALRPHLQRMEPSYAATFSDAEIARHVELIERLDDDTPAVVEADAGDDGTWRVTIVGYDYLGELSIITGLFFVHGLNIVNGHVFTYEPLTSDHDASPSRTTTRRRRRRQRRRPSPRRASDDARRKIVDVFTVTPEYTTDVSPALWDRYAADLTDLLRLMQAGQHREAHGELAKRVGTELRSIERRDTQLYPVDIEIDNETSETYTVLHIQALDTIGFLYEFTNALALNRVHIAHVTIETQGNRVHDVLYVTDAEGNKITSPERQRELRAATVLVKHFTHLLPASPNPETALQHFRELLGQLFERPNWPDELTAIERPEVLDALARLLGVSEFLWQDFLRMQYDNLFPVVRTVATLDHRRSRERMRDDLQAEIAATEGHDAKRAALNAFKDREMFRIDMRYILGQIEAFEEFSAELTDLAEVVVAAALDVCTEELQTTYGESLLDSDVQWALTVLALGKCGGRELGFASDVELMFVYDAEQSAGPEAITAPEYFEKVVAAFLQTIRAKREGVFEVDLRLRPYGKAGSLAVSIDAFRTYFAPDGPAWPYERQALVKLRPIAGDVALGERVEALRDAFLYRGEPFDVAAMRAMRERQVRHLVTPGTLNAKHSPGGLVDVEYIVQGLQITHGHRDPNVRRPNTREAMAALADLGVLTETQHTTLADAYLFLRRLIEALRMVRGNAKDLTVPLADSEEFAFLARRLRYADDTSRLQDDIVRHVSNVQELGNVLLE